MHNFPHGLGRLDPTLPSNSRRFILPQVLYGACPSLPIAKCQHRADDKRVQLLTYCHPTRAYSQRNDDDNARVTPVLIDCCIQHGQLQVKNRFTTSTTG